MSKDNRTSNSLKNIKIGITNKLITMILSFVSRRLFIQYIGIEYLGINGLFAEILGVLSLADLGFGTAMTYSFYGPIAKNDTRKISALLRYYKTVYNVIAAAVAVLGLSLVPFLKYIVKTKSDIPYLELYYIVFLADIVVSYLYVYKSTIIYASQKQYIVSQYQIYISLSKTLIQLIIVMLTQNYLLYILVGVFTTLANNLLVSYKASQLYPEIKEKYELESAEKKNIFNNLGSMFLYKLSGTLLNSTDNTLISTLCGTVFVGYYANYKTITTNVNAFVTIIFSSLTASIGNLIVTADEKNRYKIFKTMQMVSFFMATLSIVCMYHLLHEFMVVIWLGTDKYLFDKFTFMSILLNFYLAITLQPLWSYREATGLYRKTRYIMVAAAIINLILSVILGLKFGVGGIILASFIAKIVTYVWYEPKLLFSGYFNQRALYYFIDQAGNVVVLAISLAISYFCVRGIVVTGVISWCIKAAICTVIVCIVFFVRYFKTEEFKYIADKFMKRISR